MKKILWVLLLYVAGANAFANEPSSTWQRYKSDAKIIEGLMWEDQPLNKKRSMTIGEAREHCEDLELVYFGKVVDAWRLPTLKELKILSRYHKRLHYGTSNTYWSSSTSKKGKPMMVVMANGNATEAYHPAMLANVRCVKSKIKGYVSKGMKLTQIMKILSSTVETNKIQKSTLTKPTIPSTIPPMPLEKDEFETSETFAKRVVAEKKRVAKINVKQKQQYEEALRKYKKAVEEEKHTSVTKTGTSQLGKAMYIKYGKPLIRSAMYDADKEMFDISIVSERAYIGQCDMHRNLLTKENLLGNGLYSISRVEHINENLTEITMKAHKRKYGFYFGRHFGAKEWDAHSKEWLTLQDYDREWSPSKGDILKFNIPSVNLMYYTFGGNRLFIDNTPVFKANYRLHVPLQFAKKFKTFLLEKAFDIRVKVRQKNGKIVLDGLEGVDDPKRWVAEHEFIEVYESIEGLEKFIETYKDEPYVRKAVEQKAHLEALQAERAKEDAKKAKQRAMREAKEREAYAAKKRVGDKVCMKSKMLLFMTVKVSGYVESVNGDKIQIRIADTEGQTPNYNGVTLRQGTMIWDGYDKWKGCE